MTSESTDQKPKKADRSATTRARRTLIVETAMACIVEKGLHQTSVRDIAARAGISLGNLYNHFANKDALIAEIAALEAQGLEEAFTYLRRISDPGKAFDKAIELYVKEAIDPASVALSSELLAEGVRNPDLVSDFLENHAQFRGFLAGLIDQVAMGAKDLPSDKAAEFVIDMIEGFAVRFTLEGRKPSGRDKRHLKAAINRVIGRA